SLTESSTMFHWFSRQPRRTSVARVSRRPQVELLEDRVLPTINSPFTVSFSGQFDKQPSTASSANGMSVIVWAQESTSTSNTFNIQAQLYGANQNQIGGTIAVSSSADDEFNPEVAMDANGNFAVVWARNFNGSGDLDVQFALFNNAGSLVASKGVANSLSVECSPHLGISRAGTFVVTYTVGGNDILANRFDATGHPVGPSISVAARSDRTEFNSRIDMAPNGRF